MARIILIDNNSGYIFGESNQQDCSDESLVFAAKSIDHDNGVYGRDYRVFSSQKYTTNTGYHCYRSDVRSGEQIGLIHDGQDQNMINAVEECCEYVGFVACIS